MMLSRLCEIFVIVISLSEQDSDNTGIFLNTLIQFYSNRSGDRSSPLNFRQYAVLPHNIEIVL